MLTLTSLGVIRWLVAPMSKVFYADGTEYSTIKGLASALQIPYEIIKKRVRARDSFFVNDVFITTMPPEMHGLEKTRVLKRQWKASEVIPSTRRLVNEKPTPLLGFGHITHGINDRFGY